MNFYIAIVFFCVNGECAFFKGDTNYYDKVDCQKKVVEIIEDLNQRSITNNGACLLIKLDQT
jgi:hypothetical protein